MLTAALLNEITRACGGRAKASVVNGIVANQHHLLTNGINTVDRLAAWCGQALVETDYFKTLKEYWGPTATQKRYEMRADLGNTEPGDGRRYMGRGVFQLTGRANYDEFGRKLGINLEGEPELAETPDVSIQTSVLYWNGRKLSPYADRWDIKAISRAINRGNAKAKSAANHEADRIKASELARSILQRNARPQVARFAALPVDEPETKEVVVEVAAEPEITPNKIYTEGKQVKLVQEWLGNLGWLSGEPSGEIGTLTEGAVSAYRNAKGLPPGQTIDDELILALATDEQPRQLSSTRTDATPEKIREKVPEAKATWLAKITSNIATFFSALGAFFAMIWNSVKDNLGEAREYLDPIRDTLGDVPTWVWFAGVGVAAFLLSRQMRKGEKASIEAFQTAKRQ